MSTVHPSSAPDPFAQFRVLAFALIGAIPIMYIAVGFALGEEVGGTEQAPLWLHAVLVAILFAAYGAGLLSLQTVPALDPSVTGDAGLARAIEAYRANMILRFAVTEAPLVALIGAIFVLDYGLWPALVAVPVGIVLVTLSIYPTRTNLQRVQDRLESRGARTDLVAAAISGPR